MAQVGELLKQAREEQGYSLEQVAAETKIQPKLLEALENEDFTALAAPVVCRGLLRNYALFLELDPAQVLEAHDQLAVSPSVRGRRLSPSGIEYKDISLIPKSRVTADLIIGLLIIIVVLGSVGVFVYYQYLVPLALQPSPPTPNASEERNDAPLILPTLTPVPTFTPVPTPTLTPTPAYYTGVTVELRILEPSWVQILVDDERAFEGILEVGATPSWRGDNRVAIRAGNAGGVEVFVNGVSQGMMGELGQVVDQVWELVE